MWELDELRRLAGQGERNLGGRQVGQDLIYGGGKDARATQSDDLVVGDSLGDSGFTIIRNGEVHFASKSQTHYFNCPVSAADEMAAGKL